MKTHNKFLISLCVKKTKTFSSLFLGICLVFLNIDFSNINTLKEINNEFVTNNLIKTNITEEIIQINRYTWTSKKQDLKTEINKEITNRIDVYKTNKKILNTTEKIENLASEITQSKQLKDLETAEITLCSSANSNVPNDTPGCKSEFKSYMAYTAVTRQTSEQYKLLYSDRAHTDKTTGIRMIDDRYCIAVGTGYCSKIGTKINIVLENGNIIKCILGDVKADEHTDKTNRFHRYDGSVAEFIVDYEVFNKLKDESGTVNWIPGFEGKISKVIVIDDEKINELYD